MILVRIPIEASDIWNPFMEGKFSKYLTTSMTDPTAVRFRELTNKNYRNFLRSAVVRKINLYSIYAHTVHIILLLWVPYNTARGSGVVTRNSHSASTMYDTQNPWAPYTAYSVYLRRFFAGEGGWRGDEKDEIKNKITNRDVAVIRASGNNNYYHYGPGRRIIIICESVVVSRHTHIHIHTLTCVYRKV